MRINLAVGALICFVESDGEFNPNETSVYLTQILLNDHKHTLVHIAILNLFNSK
jgi:hypothetical protein